MMTLHAQAYVSVFTPDDHIRRMKDIEADVLRLALINARGSISCVARGLGIGRSTLYRKLREHRIRLSDVAALASGDGRLHEWPLVTGFH
jgi:transcriptional regulator of acetoin/glycerol metabolism